MHKLSHAVMADGCISGEPVWSTAQDLLSTFRSVRTKRAKRCTVLVREQLK